MTIEKQQFEDVYISPIKNGDFHLPCPFTDSSCPQKKSDLKESQASLSGMLVQCLLKLRVIELPRHQPVSTSKTTP